MKIIFMVILVQLLGCNFSSSGSNKNPNTTAPSTYYIPYITNSPNIIGSNTAGCGTLMVMAKWPNLTTEHVTKSSNFPNCFDQDTLISFAYLKAASTDGTIVYATRTSIIPFITSGVYNVFIRKPGEEPKLITKKFNGNETSLDSLSPTISSDGRYVCFFSWDDEIVNGDSNNYGDVFIYDTVNETSTRIKGAGNPNGESTDCVISRDGKYAVFTSAASNLVAGDTNGVNDIFLYNRVSAQITRLSISSVGTQANGDSSTPRLSKNGRYVVFDSQATNLIAGETTTFRQVYLRDTVLNTTTRVSRLPDGSEPDQASGKPDIDDSGRYVSFLSSSINLDSSNTVSSNTYQQLFLYDKVTNTTKLVTKNLNGSESQFDVYWPAITGDGKFLIFNTYSTNLVSPVTTNSNIYIYDVTTSTIELLSRDSDGNESMGAIIEY